MWEKAEGGKAKGEEMRRTVEKKRVSSLGGNCVVQQRDPLCFSSSCFCMNVRINDMLFVSSIAPVYMSEACF